MTPTRLAILSVILAAATRAQTSPLTVCEALSVTGSPKEVVIKAFASRGPHGAYLDAGIGEDPCPGWPHHLFTAPPVIGLNLLPLPDDDRTGPERAAAYAFLLRLIDVARKPGWDRYVVTARGTLVRKPFPLIFRKRDGSYIGFGFGMYGGALAEFILRSIIAEGYVASARAGAP